MNFLHEKNIKFVIRIRNNAKMNKFSNIFRCINQVIKKVYNNKTKKFISLLCNNEYKIITNLPEDSYNDTEIYNLYQNRWSIEVFFKYLKSNCKISNLKEKKKVDIDKLLICNLIVIYISRILKKYFIDKNNKILKEKKDAMNKCKINETKLIKGVYDKLLKIIIGGNLDLSTLD